MLFRSNEAAAAVEPIVLRLPKLIAVESLAYLGAPIGYRVPRVWAERKGEPPTANEAAAAVEPIVLRLPKLIAVESVAYLGAPSGYRVPRVQPGKGTSANGHGVDGKRKSVPSPPTAADLEIGGAYTVPRKKQAGAVQGAAAAVDLTALLSPNVWARRPQYRKMNVRNR